MKNSEVREAILEFMRGKSYAPLNAEALIQQIPIDGRQISHFWQVMLALEENGEIVKTRFATFGLPEKMGLVVGRFQLTSKGFGFVIPDNKGEGKDVFIPPRAIGGAMNNDRVMARIETRVSGMKPEGEVIRIIKRANNKIVGIFAKTGDFGFVVPDDKRIGQDIYIARKNFGGAKPGQKVVIEITDWPEERKSAEGRIIEVLGTPGDVGLEILSIIKQNDLPLEFPEEVINASKRVPVKISDADLRGRRDLRALPVVTIDGEDAKDLDDAVFVRQQGDDFLLGVHIADVSHYVRENALLDREARLRGTSVYLVDRVIPMLPERLSNGICSLNAGEDRLSMSCEMLVDRKGRIKAYEVFPSVIRVSKRLNYREVREILVDKDAVLLEKYRDLVPMLLEMEEVCKLLRNKRVVRGAVDFDFPEQKVILDEEGRPTDIVQRVRSISESIVEEFMLAANETVARHMSNQEWPFIYRVHDLPSEDKMTDLAQLLNNFNVKLPISEEIKPLEVQKALKQMQGRPEERLVATVTLRSMKQAVYQVENIGHFGLAAEYYTHFTSPIRRYPDLVVHRLLRQWLQNPSLKAAKRESLEAELGDIASNSSLRERAAAEAERATVDLKMAEYMAGHIGEEFDGTISGVTAFGMFVELANGVEGLVHISSLTDDYYEFQEQQYSLLGEHKRKAYRLGDKVRIEVLQVNITERNIDFIMAGENEAMRQQIMNQLLGRRGSSFSPKGGKSASSGSGKTAGNKKKTGRGPKDGKGGHGRKPAAPKTNRRK
ncbi:MAG: ribonuclease R [Acholeplasmataceae bacterium]|nr:ribonuclease R [Acholeplasmataceae bacterium]